MNNMYTNFKLTYVLNSKDNKPKALTQKLLEEMLDSEKVMNTLRNYRTSYDEDQKNSLPAIIFNGLTEIGEERKQKNYIPSGKLGLDFDGEVKGKARECFEQMKKRIEEQLHAPFTEWVSMAYVTPGLGLRLVVNRTPGLTISEEQRKWDKVLGFECDKKCKDLGRIYFLTSRQDLLYYNPQLLFDDHIPDPALYHTEYQTADKRKDDDADTIAYTTCKQGMNESDLRDVSEALEHVIGGGAAQAGNRNQQVFDMARLLRQLTGDNPDLLAKVISDYGLPESEHRRAIENALRYTDAKPYLPHDLQTAIRKAQASASAALPSLPPLPAELPKSIECILRPTPQNARPAVAMGIFSPLRTHLRNTRFHYIDNTPMEPSFMCLCVAEQAAGKTALRMPIKAILQKIEQEDHLAREKEQQWREECQRLGANKQKPAAPTAPIRIVQADMTNPALVKRARNAGEYSLYTYAEEYEKLTRLSGLSEIIRTAFDSEVYGQERVGSASVSDVCQLRWSFNASTTPQTARKRLSLELQNGTLSRMAVSTILSTDDWGEEMPVYGSYDEEYMKDITPFLDRLEAYNGTLNNLEALEWIKCEKQRQIDALRSMDARYMKPFLFRSCLMGFWRACMLYIMEGCQWSEKIEEFCSWTISYDLLCKMYLFGDLIEQAAENPAPDNVGRSTNLLALLPTEFSQNDAKTMRQNMGRKAGNRQTQNMLAQWMHRGMITFDEERNIYIKQQKYAA